MATPSKRITRLRTREPSVKAALEKKPKPEKVITTSKNSKRINVSAKDKAVTTSKNSKMVGVTAKDKAATTSKESKKRNVTARDKAVTTNKDSKKVSVTAKNKAVTTSKDSKKVNAAARNEAVTTNKDSKKIGVTAKDKAVTTSKDLKKVNVTTRNKAVTISKDPKKINVSTKGKHLRVSEKNTSLRKNKVSPRHLRPRQNKKNYCEDSRLLEQFILPKQQDSVVILKKLNVMDKHEKVPVYKAMKSDKSSEDKIDVYDFKFDSNDAMEKAKKKQRKRNVNREKGKIIKKTKKKVAAQPKRIKIIGSPELNANVSTEFARSDLPLELAAVAAESTKEEKIKKLEIIVDVAKRTETSETNADVQTAKESMSKDIEKDVEQQGIDASVPIAENLMEDTARNIETPRIDTNIHDVTTLPRGTLAKQIRKDNPNKPRIISIENVNNLIITKSPLNTEDSRPFRPKNIFDNKTSLTESNLTLRNSIFTKTLSPILKMTNTYDFGSPCRPPTLMFSKTKHFIQSTPYKDVKDKEIKKINKNSVETNKENVKIIQENVETDKENMEMDKENMDTNKESKGWRDKERKKKAVSLRKKLVQKKLPILENKAPEKVPYKSGPVRVSLGEIKNLLRSNNNEANKQTEADQTHIDVSKSFAEQRNKQLTDYLNFSDTFDVLSETERLSSVGNDVPLFMDLEPTHFSKPAQYSYKRKRAVKFEFSEDSDNEEETDKESIKPRPKKKKHIKSETEQEKRINEWVKTVNTTFQEIEEYDLVIE